MEKVIRGGYDAIERVSKDCSQDGMTHQEEADACDINKIMSRYEKTGLMAHVNEHEGQYGDFTAVTDFHTAMSIVTEAQSMFMSLPASVRGRFGNDPGAFLDYANDPANADGMRELGLLPPERPPVAAEVPEGTEGTQAAPGADSEPSTGEAGA